MPKQVFSPRPDDHEVVTKGYLRQEFSNFEKRFEKKFDKKLDKKFEGFALELKTQLAGTLEEFNKRFIPRDEYCQTIDRVLGELKATREEQGAILMLI